MQPQRGRSPAPHASTHPLLSVTDCADAMERGVSCAFMEKLLVKQNLAGLTTRQVVEQYVVPQTQGFGCSLSGVLRTMRPADVGRACYYVCHAWDCNFGRLTRTLQAVDAAHDDNGETPYFWLDIFAMNQNPVPLEEDPQLMQDDTMRQVKSAIQMTGKMVVFFDPPTDPLVLHRAWCLFECSQSLSRKGELLIRACPESPDVPDPLLLLLTDFDSHVQKLRVNFARSRTRVALDKQWLDREVQAAHPLGAAFLDDTVGGRVATWLGERAEERLDEHTSVQAMQSLSKLLATTGREKAALGILQQAVAKSEQLPGGGHDVGTLSIRHDYACLLAEYDGKFKLAEEMLVKVLAAREQRLGPDAPDTLDTMQALGRVYKARKMYPSAEDMFRKVLAHREANAKPGDTLLTLNLLALTLQAQKQYAEAEKLLKRVVSVGEQLYGPKNLDVMVWSNNFAVLLQDSKQLERAEAVFRTTLIHAEQALGPMHPHTLTIVFNLGWCLWQSGRLRSAEAFFRRELAACQTTKGAAHPDTIRSRKTLARLLKEQGRNLDEELEKADEAKEAERDAQEEEEEEGEAGLDDLGLGADEYLEGDGSIVVVVDDDLNV